MGNNNSLTEFVKKYSACHNYVLAMQDLPPTYSITAISSTTPIPDPDFYNDKILDLKLKNAEEARQNVIKKCGFDPEKQIKK